MNNPRLNGLAIMTLLCLTITFNLTAQVQIHASQVINKQYTASPTNYNSLINYDYFNDITVFITQLNTGTSVSFADQGSQHWGHIRVCPEGDSKEMYTLDGGPNQASLLITPQAANLQTPIRIGLEMTGTGRDCGSHTGPYADEAMPGFYIYVEQPHFFNQQQLAFVCKSSPPIQISDYFQGAVTGVTFYLDDAARQFASITSINPVNLNPGSHTIYAFKSYANGDYTEQIPMFISIPAQISFGVYPAKMCSNGGIQNIQVAPKGGTWSGDNIDQNGNFNPEAAGFGAHDLTYTAQDKPFQGTTQQCFSSSTITISVVGPPTVQAGDAIEVCSGSAPVPLTGGTPAGGEWTGKGVSNSNTFNPAGFLPGTYVLTYTFTDPVTGCSAFAIKSVLVSLLPQVSAGPDISVCSDEPAFDLAAIATPAGGFFTGTGILNNSFVPSSSGTGSFRILYTYEDQLSGCSGTSARQITVLPSPKPVPPANSTMCVDAAPLQLQRALPTGGVYDGPGVKANIFYPSVAGPGSQTITYTYTNPVSPHCSGSTSFIISVNPLPKVSGGGPLNVCYYGGKQVLVGSPTGGTWSGTGVTTAGVFDPQAAGVGVFNLTYSYTDQGTLCSSSDVILATVKLVPPITLPADTVICVNSAQLKLVGKPAGGVWSGTAVKSTSFDPISAGPGTFLLVYTYQDQVTACSNSASFSVTVKDDPHPVSFGNLAVCLHATAFLLQQVTPQGGIYTGDGVTNGVFTPVSAGLGNHTINYSYKDPNAGCTGSTSFIILVEPPPVITHEANFSVCLNGGSRLLNAQPSGGTWSGTGINGNSFDPIVAGIGSFIVHYSFTDPKTLCSGTDSLTIQVKLPPEILLPQDTAICKNSNLLKLTALPLGGVWSGPGVKSSNFDPVKAGVGSFELAYSFHDISGGCTGTANYQVSVQDVPIVSPPANFQICLNANPVLLQGAVPSGGVFSGDGIGNGIFSPILAGLGNHTIMYSYKDPNSGCTASASFFCFVKPLPVIGHGLSFNICATSQPLLLAVPSGGTWTGLGIKENSFDPARTGPGKYLLTYSYQDPSSECIATDTITATVIPLPVLSAGNDTTVCQSAGLIAQSGYPSGGSWSGDGIYKNELDPAVLAAGLHTVTYTYTNTYGCQAISSKTVTIIAVKPLNAGPPVTSCINSAPYDLSKDVNLTGGTWTGDGVSGTFFTAGQTTQGQHLLIYSFTNPAGCTTTATKLMTVLGLPGKVTISGSTQGCKGSPVVLFAQGDSTSDYQWYHINDTTPFATGATLTYLIASNETLYCVGVNQLQCGVSKLKAATVLLTSLTPTATIISSQTKVPFGGLVQFTVSNSTNIQNYLWSFGDGEVSTTKNSFHYFYKPGTFQVKLILNSPEGCSDSILLKNLITVGADDTVLVASGSPRLNEMNELPYPSTIFPSPFGDHIYLVCHLSHPQKIHFSLYDTYGRKLRDIDLEGVQGDNKFSIHGMDSLIIKNYYLVILQSDELNKVIKILKM